MLLLGPLHHLPDRDDRIRALGEARRVVRPGGPVFVAAISRWAGRIHGVLADQLYRRVPDVTAELDRDERTGQLRPLFLVVQRFRATPAQLRTEIRGGGLVSSISRVEGAAALLQDLHDASTIQPTPPGDGHRPGAERVPELLGLVPHLLATAGRSHG